jgi:dTDP-L-rhamnose 4-epimerase
MQCLLLGGAGFIGSRLALRLLSKGHTVRILDIFDPQIHGDNLAALSLWEMKSDAVKISVGDARDSVAVGQAFENIDTVFYLAAGTGTGQSMYQIRRYTETNVLGAAVLAEEIARRRSQIRRVIISSSRAVYGEGCYLCPQHGRVFPRSRNSVDLEAGKFNPLCPICGGSVREAFSKESDNAQPGSIYGITKLAQEQIILNVCEGLGIPAMALRYQNVYGPGQSLKNAYTGILSIFSQLLLQNRPINVFEDGLANRDFVFIDDVTEFNCRAAESLLPGCHVLNVGTGVRQTLLDVVLALGAAFQRTPTYSVSGQFRIGDIRHAAADTTRLFQTLGKHTFVSFQEGINRFAAWVLTQDIESDANSRYIKSLDEMACLGILRDTKAKLEKPGLECKTK